MTGLSMRVYAENEPMIRALGRRIEERLSRYPAQLRDLAARFVRATGSDEVAYFSSPRAAPLVHLPIWLGGELGRARLLDVLEPTALAYFYVRIQDDVLDEPGSRGRAGWLLLGNALLWDALDGLRRCSSDARFWRLAGAAWIRFSEATAAERRQLFEPRRSYSEAAFRAHARKVSLAEIPLYAVMAMRRDWSGVRSVAPLIHLLGRAYGLTNDIQGLQPDAASGHATFLVSRLAREVPVRGRRRAHDDIALETDLLERMLSRAMSLHEQARPMAKALRLDRFDAFTDERIEWLARWSRDISLARLARAATRLRSTRSLNASRDSRRRTT